MNNNDDMPKGGFIELELIFSIETTMELSAERRGPTTITEDKINKGEYEFCWIIEIFSLIAYGLFFANKRLFFF